MHTACQSLYSYSYAYKGGRTTHDSLVPIVEFFKDHSIFDPWLDPFDFVITKIHSFITRVDIMIIKQSKDSNTDCIAWLPRIHLCCAILCTRVGEMQPPCMQWSNI